MFKLWRYIILSIVYTLHLVEYYHVWIWLLSHNDAFLLYNDTSSEKGELSRCLSCHCCGTGLSEWQHVVPVGLASRRLSVSRSYNGMPHKSGVLCQKQVSRAVTSNYIPQFLWDVITCHCPWHLLLTKHSSYMPCGRPTGSPTFNTMLLMIWKEYCICLYNS